METVSGTLGWGPHLRVNTDSHTPESRITNWNEWLGTMFTKDDFLFLGPRHRFYLCFSNKSFGTRQAFLLI